ncbi:transporter substrate-binding domain-containing protein [Rheinheimera riviphila]|uniref:Transporter substrate-binding domain-containing protein n=1 Tax=Rheinheimera riviphila TaxID=1834037 RepID=A0A437QLV6_9GAMM|nr:transporter substrate-binding domain-containing protein [Rheinheimera riviphila]RVU35439.1 transporter substrate-binding domain-containing protein [Rheinheimera riviphila]
MISICRNFTAIKLLLVLWLLPFACLAQPKLKIGYFDIPPHIFASKQTPSPAIVYFDQIAKLMQRQPEYLHVPLPRLLQMLEQHQLDAILLLAKNSARQQMFVYPKWPMFTATPVLVVRADNPFSIATLQQDPTLQLGLWPGGYHSEFVKTIKGQQVPISGDQIGERGLNMLVQGRINAFFSPDQLSVRYLLQKNGWETQLKMLPVPNETIEIYTVFSKKSAVELLPPYEKALQTLQETRPYPL